MTRDFVLELRYVGVFPQCGYREYRFYIGSENPDPHEVALTIDDDLVAAKGLKFQEAPDLFTRNCWWPGAMQAKRLHLQPDGRDGDGRRLVPAEPPDRQSPESLEPPLVRDVADKRFMPLVN